MGERKPENARVRKWWRRRPKGRAGVTVKSSLGGLSPRTRRLLDATWVPAEDKIPHPFYSPRGTSLCEVLDDRGRACANFETDHHPEPENVAAVGWPCCVHCQPCPGDPGDTHPLPCDEPGCQR